MTVRTKHLISVRENAEIQSRRFPENYAPQSGSCPSLGRSRDRHLWRRAPPSDSTAMIPIDGHQIGVNRAVPLLRCPRRSEERPKGQK